MLPVWKLAAVVLGTVLVALAVRRFFVVPYLMSLPMVMRAGKTGRIDFALFTASGLLIALINWQFFDLPLLHSGGKIVLGMVSLGLFASIDLALESERKAIAYAQATGRYLMPPKQFTPLTRKFFAVATSVTILFSTIILLAVFRDLWWFTEVGLSEVSLQFVKRSILIDLLFIMGMLLAFIINLVLSYARNLRLLFDNQTGILARVSNGDMDGFVPVATQDEFGFIAGHTNMMIEGLRDRLRLVEGIAVAREVQETLLPAGPPSAQALHGKLAVAGRCLYSDETGGDYYDYLPHWADENSDSPALGIVIGDVTGHGVGAALLMASVRAFVRMRASGTTDPAALLHDVNEMTVADSYGTGRFVTMFLLRIDPATLQMTWAVAGHEPAMLYRRSENAFMRLHAGGLPLGTIRDTVYESASCPPLQQGDVVLLYTDGLIEARNAEKEMFGRARVRRVVQEHAASGAQAVVDALCDAVARFRGKAAQNDDVTIVAISVA